MTAFLLSLKWCAGGFVLGAAVGYWGFRRRKLKCPRCDRALVKSRVRDWTVYKCPNCGVTLDEFEARSL